MPDLGAKPVPARERLCIGAVAVRHASAWPADGWWTTYSDPQLDRLIAKASPVRPTSPPPPRASARAQGLAQQAGAALLPSLDATGSVDRSEAEPEHRRAGPERLARDRHAGLSSQLRPRPVRQEPRRARAAKNDAEAARYDADEARLLLTTGIASAYADLAALYAQRDSLQSALDIRTQTLKLVQQRFDAGLDNQSEREQAKARIPQTNADLAATDEAIMLDKHALAALVGQGPDRALTIARRPSVRSRRRASPPMRRST